MAGLFLAAERFLAEFRLQNVVCTPAFDEKLRPGGNANHEFTARPLTYQRFRQNAVLKRVMGRSWI
jgi:hypothetical protein